MNISVIDLWTDAVRGNWLWFVSAGIAVCVVVGYIVVRRRLHRAEAAGDGPLAAGAGAACRRARAEAARRVE